MHHPDRRKTDHPDAVALRAGLTPAQAGHDPPHREVPDTDPGADDVVALLFAMASPDELNIRALTTVAGNVRLDKTSRNARLARALELYALDRLGLATREWAALLATLDDAERYVAEALFHCYTLRYAS